MKTPSPSTQPDAYLPVIIIPRAETGPVPEASSVFQVEFPLSSDHLIHLIHHNVLRALLSNKALLLTTTISTMGNRDVPVHPSSRRLCDGVSIIKTVDASLPQSLLPTHLQMLCPHSSWINMLPFAQMRDNLIRWQDSFDHTILCNDLFGDAFNTNQPTLTDRFMGLPSSEPMKFESSLDDEVTAERKGLIVWAEPSEPGSWEITPGFFRKWAWLLFGCEDLIVTSNRWRALRGEAPIQLEDVLEARDQFAGNSLQISEQFQ